MTACASSTKALAPAADPVVITKVETRVECPAEVTAILPSRVARPAAGTLRGDSATLAWVNGRFRREEALEQRLIDAKTQCPASQAEGAGR